MRRKLPGQWIEQIGQFGLLVFSLGLMSGAGLIAAGKILMGVAFVLWLPRMWRLLVRDRLFVLSVVFYAYMLTYVLFVTASAGVDPGLRGADSSDFFRVGFLTALVTAFWWARLREGGRFSWPIWGFLLGFHARLLTSWPLEDWSQGIPWKLGFGLYYNPFGMFCALVVAWWLVLLFRQEGTRSPREVAAIAFASLIPLLGLVYSASRGAIGAFLVALLLMFFLWLRDRKDVRFSWRQIGGGAVALALLGLAIFSGPVAQRDPQSRGEIGRILQQGVSVYVPQRVSSIGTRIVIWREGTRLWLEKPLFGHGPAPTENFLMALKQQYRLDDSFDFESTYLELLVRLGLVGTMFFVVHLGFSLQSLRRGMRARWYPAAAGRYLLLACVIFGGALFFREGLLDLRGRNFATFLLAGLYSFQAAKLWAMGASHDPGRV